MNPFWLAVRCSPRGVLAALTFGALTVGGAVLAGAPTAIGIASIVAITLLVFAVHSAWRMAQGLGSFARAVPEPADVQARASGRAQLAWPSLDLTVQSRAGVLREPRLEGEADGEPFEGEIDDGHEVAERALESLGVEAVDAPT